MFSLSFFSTHFLSVYVLTTGVGFGIGREKILHSAAFQR